jgi:hypothetical protein
MTEQEIITELNKLEHWALIYSSADRVKYNELQVKIRELEMKLLDYMVGAVG